MLGVVISFDKNTNTGLISSENKRYEFKLQDFNVNNPLVAKGLRVDFEVESTVDGKHFAKNIYPLNRVVKKGKLATFFALIAFGGSGLHRFYLRDYDVGCLYFLGILLNLVIDYYFNAHLVLEGNSLSNTASIAIVILVIELVRFFYLIYKGKFRSMYTFVD